MNTILLPTFINTVLAKYSDKPLLAKAITMATGISNIIVLSCCINIFSTAGSSSQAIVAVLPATPRDKKSEIIIFFKYFFM